MDNLFGIPMPLIGFACFILAAVFVYVWPKPKARENRSMWLNMGLHHLHPLTWVLLGMAAFLHIRDAQTATIIAILGGFSFLFFLVLWIRTITR
jgi:hypothetical protein